MRFCTFAAALILALPAAPLTAGQIAFTSDWTHQRFSLFSRNDYRHEGSRLTLVSNQSVSLTWRALPKGEWDATGAGWSWSVAQSVPPTDLSRKGGDDRNLSLYFVFLPEDRASAMQGASIRTLLDAEEARVLVYVWGGAHARGDVLASPYLGPRGRTIVLRPAGTGAHAERVDLERDYARAFEGAPGALVGLAVSGDSDDTSTAIRGTISNLVLD